MGKHVIDGPRKHDDSDRLEQYTKLDKAQSEEPGPQSSALHREPRRRNPGEKLRRYTEMDRGKD